MNVPEIPEDDVSCADLVELVTDYFEGALPEEERIRFESHMGYCEGCENYVEQMRRTIEATGHLTEEDIDPAVRERLVEAFRGWKRN